MLPEVTDFCRLILLRYPELAQEQQEAAVGAGSAPLSRRGLAMVGQWMRDLSDVPVDQIYAAAGQEQCVEPARALAETMSVPLAEEALLCDQQMGEWQGRTWQDVARTDPDRMQTFFSEFGEVRAPGGESLGEAVERMLSWWGGVSKEGLGRSLVVITAGGLITGFTAAMLGLRLSRCVSLNLPHGGMGILELFANGARIASWNPGALLPDR